MILKNAVAWIIAELSASPDLVAAIGSDAILFASETIPTEVGVFVSCDNATRSGERYYEITATITIVAENELRCFDLESMVHRAIGYEGGRPKTFRVAPNSKRIVLRFCRRANARNPETVGPNDPLVSMSTTYSIRAASLDDPT